MILFLFLFLITRIFRVVGVHINEYNKTAGETSDTHIYVFFNNTTQEVEPETHEVLAFSCSAF